MYQKMALLTKFSQHLANTPEIGKKHNQQFGGVGKFLDVRQSPFLVDLLCEWSLTAFQGLSIHPR